MLHRFSFVIPNSQDDPLTLTLSWLSSLCVTVGATNMAILYVRLGFTRGVDVRGVNEIKVSFFTAFRDQANFVSVRSP